MRHSVQFKKQFFVISRWLHIYVAMTFFTLLLFFCVTGITLNHTDWFKDKSNTQIHTLTLPKNVLLTLQAEDTPELASTQAFIEAETKLANPRSIDMDIDAGEISFDYPLPAGYAFITVYIASGKVEVEHKEGSLIMLLNDLHKGRHTGIAWSWVIDITAIAISIFSLTGLVILFQHSKKRNRGLIMVAMGFILPVIAYFIWVPFLSIH
ncbi:MAG: hypothetical protein COB34_04700 [Methylophilaceae bacterium]|nr:MAG: hypothetical protein COB34_04700 [Methylophilaceae bacterium]